MAQKYSIYAIFRMQDQISPGMGRLAANMKHFGNMASSAGRSMTTRLTAPIALFGGATIKAAIEFDTSMNRVEARSQMSEEALESLRQQAKLLGSTTSKSATEAADGMAFLAQAGWEANDILTAMPAIVDLAASSEMDLARAADITSNIMGGFSLEASEATRVVDILAAVSSSANVDMEMLGESFGYSSKVAKEYGLSMESAAAATGLLGNVGIQGSQAGTSLRKILLGMSAPSAEAEKMMKSLGITFTKTMANGEEELLPFAEAMLNLSNGMMKLGSADQMKSVKMLFGNIGMPAALEMLSQMKSGKFQEYAKQLLNVEGRARSMAEIMMQGAPGAVLKFQSAFEGMMLAIAGSGLLEWFADMMETMTKFVTEISETDKEMLKWGVIAAGAAAAAGPLLLIVGGMASGFGMMIKGTALAASGIKMLSGVAMTALPMITKLFMSLSSFVLANPIVLGMAAIAAAVAGAAYVIYDNWDNITAYFSEKWAEVTAGFKSGFIDGVVALLQNFNPFSLIFDMWDGLINYITGFDLGAYLSKQMSDMASALPGWMKDMVGIDEGVQAGAAPISPAVKNVISGGRGRDARAKLDVNFNNLPFGARVHSENSGDGMDLGVGVGYAWGR